MASWGVPQRPLSDNAGGRLHQPPLCAGYHFSRIPRASPVPNREYDNLPRVDPIDDPIGVVEHLSVRRLPDLWDHPASLRELF